MYWQIRERHLHKSEGKHRAAAVGGRTLLISCVDALLHIMSLQRHDASVLFMLSTDVFSAYSI